MKKHLLSCTYQVSPIRVAMLCSLACVLISGKLHADTGAVSWKRAGDDLEIGTVKTGSIPFLSGHVTLLRTKLKQFRIGVVRAQEFDKKVSDVRDLCRRSKATACINANFFDEQDKPLGLVVSQGKVFNKMHRGGKTITGVFQLNRSGMQILSRDQVIPEKIVEAVQAGPRLVSDSKPINWSSRNSQTTRRSGVCIDKQNRLVMFVVSAGLIGISPTEIQQLLLSPAVQCKDALNLDGGGSTQFYFSGAVRGAPSNLSSIFIEGSDLVPIALALFQVEAG